MTLLQVELICKVVVVILNLRTSKVYTGMIYPAVERYTFIETFITDFDPQEYCSTGPPCRFPRLKIV